MCENCSERALKLRLVALDFRVTARLGPSEISERLLRTADELDAIASGLLESGPGATACDVVWDEAVEDALQDEGSRPLPCP